MAYELEVNLPNIPKGVLVSVADLGTFENGKTTQVDENAYAVWQDNNSRVELDDEGKEVVVKPTLGKVHFQEGVTAHVVKAAKPSDKSATTNDKDKEGAK